MRAEDPFQLAAEGLSKSDELSFVYMPLLTARSGGAGTGVFEPESCKIADQLIDCLMSRTSEAVLWSPSARSTGSAWLGCMRRIDQALRRLARALVGKAQLCGP